MRNICRGGTLNIYIILRNIVYLSKQLFDIYLINTPLWLELIINRRSEVDSYRLESKLNSMNQHKKSRNQLINP